MYTKSKNLMLVALMLCLAGSAMAIHQENPVSYNLGNSGWAMVVNPQSQAVGEISVPYVFGVVRDCVVIEIDKTFGRWPDEFGLFDPLVVEFQKISENAVSKIVIRDEYIVNNTGHEWHDFHMLLAVSSSNPEAGFDPQQIPHGGQLENVSYAGFGQGYDGLPTNLNFENEKGTPGVAFQPSGLDVFRPGYAEGNITIVTNPELQVGERFLLKEIPTMLPEPATIALFAIGVMPAILKRKRNAA